MLLTSLLYPQHLQQGPEVPAGDSGASAEGRGRQRRTPPPFSFPQVSHVFTNFGKGIRYVSFEQYGRDMRSWVGHYGALVTHSSVRIRIRPS